MVMDSQDSKTKRILLYTGKGGVGKTSVAAATALRCAEMGYRTVVLSTDAAHSLGDSLETKLGPEPVEVVPNLWAQEVDVYYSLSKHWQALQKYLASVFTWQGVSDLLAEEIAIIPGMEEGAGLLWIDQHYKSNRYDVIVVDCAPTAETLRLLSLPDSGRWWFNRLFPIGKRATLILSPLARPFLNNMPLPDGETMNAAENLFGQLDHLYQLLTTPSLSSIRLVMNPEKMVIKEAQRTYTYLNLYGYLTDAVVCNRIFPQSTNGYFSAWRETQEKYLNMIEEGFSPLPIMKVPYFDKEIVGLEGLQQMGTALFDGSDPSELLFHGRAYSIDETENGFILSIPLPFAERQDVHLVRHNDELSIQVGNWRRNLILPRALQGLGTGKAKFSEGALRIQFEKQVQEVNHGE